MKLKQIPGTVVHTPTEEEAKELLAILHENGFVWIDLKRLINTTMWSTYKAETCYNIRAKEKYVSYSEKGWFERNGATILTLAEFKRLYCEEEKPQPRFKVGDKVRIINDCGCNAYGLVGVVESLDPKSVDVTCDDIKLSCLYEWIEPYTEPKTKPTEDMEAKEEKSENPINLCELLQGHEGETFYSLVIGECTLTEITTSDTYPIKLSHSHYSSDGKFESTGVPVVYPSRALYEQYPLDPLKAWSVWQEEQEYEISVSTRQKKNDYSDIVSRASFRTPTDRDKCIKEIKAIIEKHSKQQTQ